VTLELRGFPGRMMFLKAQFSPFEAAIEKEFTSALVDAGQRRADVCLFLSEKSMRLRRFEAEYSAFMPPGAVCISWNGIASLWACAQGVARLGRRLLDSRQAGKSLVYVDADPEIRTAINLYELSRRLAKHEFTRWVDWAPPIERESLSKDSSFGNLLFLRSMGWIIRHELAHLKLDHHYKIKQKEITELAAEEEADAHATDWLRGSYSIDQARLPGQKPREEELGLEMRAVAAGVGLLWIGLFEESFRTRSKIHPPPAERFIRCFERLDLATDSFAATVMADCVKSLVDPEGNWGHGGSKAEATAAGALQNSLIHFHRYLNERTG
jgi:hypothetical protein